MQNNNKSYKMSNKSNFTRTLIALLLALFGVSGVWAEDITEEQALERALSFLKEQQTTPGKSHNNQLSAQELTLASKVSGLYVFNVEDNRGFIVVSNDDRTYPILGFSESGNFSKEEMPDNMRAWLQGYADEIAWLQKQTTPKKTVSRPTSKVGSHSTTAVAPLCTSEWDQDAPYNNLCPTYTSWGVTEHCATGCVATAMAQVMYYHKWPTSSTKIIPGYTCSDYTLSSLPITTFDWSNMKDSYSSSYTTAQGNAVAKLMQYCGYSVKMDYGPSSGAYTEDVAIALREYFDYNPYTTRFVSRSSYTYDNWTDMIYHEVSHNRPVCYGGMSSGGGHEFVCDGYKFESNTDFFHINWGWGGMSDNYFVLSALDPDQQGIGGSTSTDGFHYGQDAVIGIQKSTDSGTTANIPANVVNLTLNSVTLSRNPVEPYTMVNITFNITNNSSDPYDGDLWLVLRESNYDYLIEHESVLLSAGTTQDVVISHTPSQTGTYTFMLCYINAAGEYVTYEGKSVTLNVVESLTNDIVPVYGYWTDNYSRSQFIIGEADLEDMIDGTINAMTFTASQSSVSWGSAKFDVYLKEVEESTISALKDWNTLDKVYSGSLSIVNSEMTITFSEPYPYQGGNLLVGINQTVTGSYKKCSWYGQTVTGASVGGYGTSISQQNFLPDVTFDFTPGAGIHVKKPKDLAVSYTGGDEATVSWTSDEPAFDIEVNGIVTEDVSNPCTLTGLEYATTYNIKVRAKNQDVFSDWTDAVSFTTELSGDMCQIRLELTDATGDGWNGNAIKVVDVLTGTELGTFANTDEVGKNEAQIYYVEVPNDRDIEFQWVNGIYFHECTYVAYDVAGNEIFSGKGKIKTPVTYHVDCNAVLSVVLANNEDNTALIESKDGATNCEVTLQNRTLYKDDGWNTICLPFDVTIAESPLAGAIVKELDTSNTFVAGNTLMLNFKDVTDIEAGKPYFIKWAKGDDISNPVFTGVTVKKDLVPAEVENVITFSGNYAPVPLTAGDKSILYVGSSNKLYYPASGSNITLNAFRAYFQLADGYTMGNPSNPIKEFVLRFSEDDATSLGEELRVKSEESNGGVYDLSGRKVNGKLPKGVYIINGKKRLK